MENTTRPSSVPPMASSARPESAPSEVARPRNTPKLLLTTSEVAERIGLHRTTIYELMVRGELRSVKVGRRRLIPPDWLEEWVEARKAGAQAADAQAGAQAPCAQAGARHG